MPKKDTEPTDPKIEEAGKGSLDDEMLPNEGEPVEQESGPGGEQPDSAGEHGDMAVETAKTLEEKAKESGRES